MNGNNQTFVDLVNKHFLHAKLCQAVEVPGSVPTFQLVFEVENANGVSTYGSIMFISSIRVESIPGEAIVRAMLQAQVNPPTK